MAAALARKAQAAQAAATMFRRLLVVPDQMAQVRELSAVKGLCKLLLELAVARQVPRSQVLLPVEQAEVPLRVEPLLPTLLAAARPTVAVVAAAVTSVAARAALVVAAVVVQARFKLLI